MKFISMFLLADGAIHYSVGSVHVDCAWKLCSFGHVDSQ